MQIGQRSSGIDILRGLCILAVLMLHIDGRIPFSKCALGAYVPHTVNSIVFRSGYYGVRVFFVISGFLITANILRRWGALERTNLMAFYKLRLARIGPCLLALLAILAALHVANLPGFVIDPKRTTLVRALAAALMFHVNELEMKVGYLPANWDVLWSLAVEEVFYLIYPLLCRFCPNRWLLAFLGLGLVVAGPFARTTWAANELAQDYAYFAGFDCIALGCAAAVLSQFSRFSPRQQRGLRWLGAAMMLLIVVFRGAAAKLHLWQMGLDVTVLALGTAFVLSSADRRNSGARWSAPLQWLGRNSYEIYLTHGFITVCGLQAFHALKSSPNTTPLWHVGMVTASGLLGWTVAKYYSEPLNRRLRARGGTNKPRSLPCSV